ncbi:MAG: glycosyltransferase, partial [Vulcanimicrobiota bacterium]
DKFVGRSLPMMILAWFNLKLCDLFAPWDDERTKENFTVANSYFTSESYRALYGKEADAVVYPPPVGSARTIERAHRKLAFLAMARADPQKGWDDTVGIVKGLRDRGHNVTLTMFVLTSSSAPVTLQWIKENAESNSSWLTLRLNASRAEIDRAIGEHRFGLHCGWGETYGMAVAEMLLGGCLTSVRESGGQTEIVTELELRFRRRKDAIEKWDAILRDPELEARLLSSQAARRELYSREAFFKNFHTMMDQFEARYPVPP